jgi:predicted metal-binding membrane protein
MISEEAGPEGFARIRILLLLASLSAWVPFFASWHSLQGMVHCGSSGLGPLSVSFNSLLMVNPPATFMAGWAVMVVAMMFPLLTGPTYHICSNCFVHHQRRLTTLFVLSYSFVWMMVGVVLWTVELIGKLLVPGTWLLASIVAIVALIWQCSPVKQRCLNRCHLRHPLSAFGRSAEYDAISFGFMHGVWCTGSCWVWMLLPLLLPRGHFVAMVPIAALILSERLEHPDSLRWRWRGPGKAIRILIAQARIRLDSRERSWAPNQHMPCSRIPGSWDQY